MRKDYEDFVSYLGYDQLDDRVYLLYQTFLKQYDKKTAFISQSELDDVLCRLDLDMIYQKEIKDSYNTIAHHADLNKAIAFLKYILVVGAHPSHWYVKKAPEPKASCISVSAFQCMTLLALIPHSIKSYQEKKIDESHILFNLGHLKGYIQSFYKKHQRLGIDNFGWCTYLASLGLIALKSLNFMHHIFSDPYRIYQNTDDQHIIILVEPNINVRKDGQLDGVNGVYNQDFLTTLEETDNEIKGYRVHPFGYIENKQVSLKKSQWKLIVKKGDPVIDFHIPTKKGYSISDIKDSFLEAKTFFQTHYKEYDYRAFWCVSWLYSPQLDHLIKKPESHIIDVARQGYICPATPGEKSLFTFVFQTETPDFQTITPKTSLEKNVIDYVNQNGKINTGMYIYLLEDVSVFGSRPYITKNDTDNNKFQGKV